MLPNCSQPQTSTSAPQTQTNTKAATAPKKEGLMVLSVEGPDRPTRVKEGRTCAQHFQQNRSQIPMVIIPLCGSRIGAQSVVAYFPVSFCTTPRQQLPLAAMQRERKWCVLLRSVRDSNSSTASTSAFHHPMISCCCCCCCSLRPSVVFSGHCSNPTPTQIFLAHLLLVLQTSLWLIPISIYSY